MTQTIYLPILQYSGARHQTFLELLCANFKVVMTRLSPVALPSESIEWVEDIVAESCSNNEGDFEAFDGALDTLTEYFDCCMKYVVGDERAVETTKSDILNNTESFETIYNEAKQFYEVSRRRKIDYVIASCDHAYLSRPAVHVAKLLGIHTVSIQHGYFGMLLEPSVYEAPQVRERDISDTLILDNALEVDLLKKLASSQNDQRYLPLGTPMDHSYNPQAPAPETSLRPLGLQDGPKTLLLALSWLIPNSPQTLWRDYDREVAFVKTVLQVLRDEPGLSEVQVIVKLHPATKSFGEHRNVLRFYRMLCSDYGISTRAAVTNCAFDDVLPLVDVVISWNLSSVLFDSAMVGKPVAQLLHPDALASYKHDPNLHSEMARAGLFRMLGHADELVSYLNTVLADDFPAQYRANLEIFKHKWSIVQRSVEEKSMNIIEWLKSSTG